MPESIKYRGNKYEIFQSENKHDNDNLVVTYFEGTGYKDLKSGDYVAIEQRAYRVIGGLKEFRGIKLDNNNAILGCIFMDEIDLSYNKDVIIQNSIFLDDCYYVEKKDKEKEKPPLLKIDFAGVDFEKNCIIASENFTEKSNISFNRCHFGKKLKISNKENHKFYTDRDREKEYEISQRNKQKIKELKITDCTAGNEAYLRIGFLDVENFELSNLRLPQNAELNIGDCRFQNFKLTNFRNIGKFKLYKINILDEETNNQKFQIDNTSIGQTDFQSIDLTLFKKVIMFDNIFSNVDYTNVLWIKEKEIDVGQYQNDTDKINKKQDTYRTLKNVAQRNNDQPQALIFYTKEMENTYKTEKWHNFSNKSTMWFNKLTNNFGLNWWRPIAGLFGFGLLFYCFILLSLYLGYCELQMCGQIDNIVGNYFVFLNPIHEVRFIASGCWTSWSIFWDMFFRVISGLLIYQTIQAFRKYSRKL